MTAEFKNPARDLPRVIHTSLPLVILCYILANISYFLVLPTHVIESSNTVAVAFGLQVFGPAGALVLAVQARSGRLIVRSAPDTLPDPAGPGDDRS